MYNSFLTFALNSNPFILNCNCEEPTMKNCRKSILLVMVVLLVENTTHAFPISLPHQHHHHHHHHLLGIHRGNIHGSSSELCGQLGGRKFKGRRKKNKRTNSRHRYDSDYSALRKKANAKDSANLDDEVEKRTDHVSMMIPDGHDHQILLQQQTLDRYRWLHDATLSLLDTELHPPGSLNKGKWHELSSMMFAWSKWINANSSSPTSISDVVSTSGTSSAAHSDMSNIFDNPTQLPLIVESILKRIIDEKYAGNEDVRITTNMYNVVLESWLASITCLSVRRNKSIRGFAHEEFYMAAAQRCLDIVRHMQSEYESKIKERDEMVYDITGDHHNHHHDHALVKPNLYSFITVLKMWNKACRETSIPPTEKDVKIHFASMKANDTLQWMEYLSKSGRNVYVQPNVLCYTIVMDTYAKSGEKEAGTKAEKLLKFMLSKENANLSIPHPTLFCYNMCINAYTRQGRRAGAVDNAERVLAELEDLYKETKNESLKPDVITYTSLVTAWANSNRRGYGANRAEQILTRMMESSNDVQPNTVTFNAVLKAWCKSGDRNADERATAVFKLMEDECRKGNSAVRPDRITYNTYIHTLTKSGKADVMHHAENVLAQMEASTRLAPNLFTYSTIIEGWARVRNGNSALKAYEVLQKLLDVQRNGNKNGKPIRPDSYAFNSVIFALSRSGLKSSAVRAEELLQYMEREYRAGNSRLKPDVFGYSSAIHAWARSGERDAGVRAEALLCKMEERCAAGEKHIKPNTVTFNSVIDCWAKSGQGTFGARKAEQLLERMESMYKAGDDSVKPTARTYNSVLSAWAKSNTKCAYRKSQDLLNHMWEQYEEGHKDLKPDALAYNTVINAVSKSSVEDKAQRALRILRTMDKLYRAGLNKNARPNEFTYTSVLNSCAFSSLGDSGVKRKALDTAIFTLEELQESSYGNPNHVTYGMFLKSVANLIPADEERRRVVVEPVFLQCCKDGQVGEIVLRQLRYAAPADLYEKLLGEVVSQNKSNQVRIEDIPIEWRCNVRNEKDRSKNKRKGGMHSNYKR